MMIPERSNSICKLPCCQQKDQSVSGSLKLIRLLIKQFPSLNHYDSVSVTKWKKRRELLYTYEERVGCSPPRCSMPPSMQHSKQETASLKPTLIFCSSILPAMDIFCLF